MHAKKPAIIVFVYLNAVAGNPWSLIPLSSAKNGFMTFTEIELGAFFQKREDLHPELKSLINHRDRGRRLTQAEVINNWFPLQAPGLFIKHFIAPVDPRLADGKRLRGRMKKKAGIAAAFKVLIPSEIRAHVNLLQSDDFDPRNYTEKSYVLLGSIKTERYELQVSACKLRELNSVKYKRYPSERLPDHPFTTIAGTDNYLTEARNVFKNRDDVEQLLGCIADMVHTISYLGIDPGQACIVGSLATLLSDKEPRICRRRNRRKRKKNKRGIRRRNPRGKRQRKPRDIDSRHINISTKQKPVALPTLRDRKWMENRKCTTLVEPGIIQLAQPIFSDTASLQAIVSTLRTALDRSVQEVDLLRKQNEELKKQIYGTIADDDDDDWSSAKSSESSDTSKDARGYADNKSKGKGKGKTVKCSNQSNLRVKIIAVDGSKYAAKISHQALQEYSVMVIQATAPSITLRKCLQK
ncbi:hypothetical protein BGX20_004077 [Mortierella sp. AD010]|nr:hypothetical protein BGX20_004077 [Mortierella sp. AD010]